MNTPCSLSSGQQIVPKSSALSWHFASLLLRCTNGAIFIAHGWVKFLDIDGFERGLATFGIPAAWFLSRVVTWLELLGGTLLLVGLWTRLAALGHALVLVGAIVYVHAPWEHGLTGPRGMEFPMAVLAASMLLAYGGGGAFSLDHLLRRDGFGGATQRKPASLFSARQKNIAISLSVSAILVIFWLGAAYWFSPAAPSVPNKASMTTAQEVIRAEEKLWEQFEKRDVDGMMERLDGDFTAFSGSMPRRMEDKAAEKEHLVTFHQTLNGQLLNWQIIHPRVQCFGETALLSYEFSVTVSIDGEKHTRTGKQTSVWAKRGNDWRQVHYHYSYNIN